MLSEALYNYLRLDCLYLKTVAITDVIDEENDTDDQIALIEKALLMNRLILSSPSHCILAREYLVSAANQGCLIEWDVLTPV